jgi:N6-L-threonylcarbamoyladenine synthase
MIILALETSCDETSAAVLKSDRGDLKLLSSIVSSQINIHKQYGGVVPEVAARHHVQNVIPVVTEALTTARIKPNAIDLMAVTSGPGLVTSLIIGVETAKSLSYTWKKPLMAVNHMYSHMAANFYQNQVDFPAVCLVVSGGHTEIIHLKNYRQYKKIGQTIDDAVGEAFDKVAKLLGLGYPGGPAVSAEAEKLRITNYELRIKLPRPMMKTNDYNFSFSGLKTAVLYATKKMSKEELKERTAEICFKFQEAAIEVLVYKTIKAAKKLKVKTVMMAGGVAANKQLREALRQEAEKAGLKFLVPEFKLCTDNAAMVAVAAYYLSEKKKVSLDNYKKIVADTNWELL